MPWNCPKGVFAGSDKKDEKGIKRGKAGDGYASLQCAERIMETRLFAAGAAAAGLSCSPTNAARLRRGRRWRREQGRGMQVYYLVLWYTLLSPLLASTTREQFRGKSSSRPATVDVQALRLCRAKRLSVVVTKLWSPNDGSADSRRFPTILENRPNS